MKAGFPAGVLLVAACASAPRAPAASPLGGGLADADRQWVEGTLARLDLRHRVAQLVVPRVSGAFLAVGSPEERRVRQWVTEYGVGGLIETLGPPMEAAVKFNALQRLADVPLMITADMEHGPGQLLFGGTILPYGLENGGGTRFPPAMGLGAANDEQLAYDLGRITAVEGRAAGVHLNFAPVVDVNNNPANPIINTRSFGADPALVGRLAAAQIRGMQDHGMLATAKHFPGHGDTGTDSHIDLPVITADPARADTVELKPYRDAIAAGVAAVMSAHIAFPALTGDSTPATLNPRLMDRLLREGLGFRGLAVTDALDMGAIVSRYGAEDAPVRALEAGADLLLQVEPDDVGRVIEAVVSAVRSGRLEEARIDRSVRRVLEAKAALGLNRDRLVDLERIPEIVGNPEHTERARLAAERSLTLVRDRDLLLPLRGRVLCIVYRDAVEPFAGRTFLAGLRGRTETLATVMLDPGADPRALDEALAAAANADVVLFAPFVRVGAYRNGLALPGPVADLIDTIGSSRPIVTVSFGNPYLLEQLPRVSTYLLAWAGWDVMQAAAARALTGDAPITGRLPIPLPPRYAVGDGITVRETAPGTRRGGEPDHGPAAAGTDSTLHDLASPTKVLATTAAAMFTRSSVWISPALMNVPARPGR